MVETDKTALPPPDLRSDEEKRMDALFRRYSDIPEPLPEKDNPDALFANGWGRRKSYSMLIASSGIGKSVITTQLFVPWALGKPGIIGSAPLHPLNVAYIQTEDDDTEMGEFRRDHRLGYQSEEWSDEDIKRGEYLVWDWSRYFDGKTDDEFLKCLELSLRRYPQDVVVINPFHDVVTADINDNSDLKKFVVHGLLNIAKDFGVFFLIVHHTNKPNFSNIKQGGVWGADDLAAYAGAGGAVLTNSARSVTFIRRCTSKECAIENSFKVIGAKRGDRLGWKNADGKKTRERIIAYSEDYIHWRVPTPEEISEANDQSGVGQGARLPKAPSIPVSPAEAADMIADIIRTELPAKSVWRVVYSKLHNKVDGRTLKAAWEHFTLNHKSYGLKMIEDGSRAYHFEPDPDFRPVPADSSADSPDDDLFDNDSQPTYR